MTPASRRNSMAVTYLCLFDVTYHVECFVTPAYVSIRSETYMCIIKYHVPFSTVMSCAYICVCV